MTIVDLTFKRPEMLWYLLSIPLMFLTHFILLYKTKRKAIRFANFEALKRVSHDKLLTKNWTVLILRLLILLTLILAISGPLVWYTTLSNKNDFVLAIDVSASMSAQDVKPTRLDAALANANAFVNALNSRTNVGLITFSGVPFVVEIPTDDKGVITSAINGIETQKAGGTDIGGAIITGTNLLLPSTEGRAILLVTDGSNTVGEFTENPVQKAVNYAAKNHVIVYTIGIGSNVGPIGYLPEYYNLSSTFDEQTLISIANQTHGAYFRATDSEELQGAYAAIGQKSENALLSFDATYGLLFVSLMMIFMEWGLINTRFRPVP